LDEAAGSGQGRWYIQELVRRPGPTPGLLLAHYDDDYRLLDGGWRFARRRLVVHYSGPPDLSGWFAGDEPAPAPSPSQPERPEHQHQPSAGV
ncbi:MAG: nuclear transport factor 2 family protein, partial [Actinomycetota bacterium]